MTEEKARELWSKRLEEPLSKSEENELTQFLLSNPKLKNELEETSILWDKMDEIIIPEPSDNMDLNFERMMYDTLRTNAVKPNPLFAWFELHWKIGFSALAVGLVIGLFLSPKEQTQVDQLASEVSDLKKMMVLSLIDKPQAQDRIRAVSMVSEVEKSDEVIVAVLIETMNNDKSINVRLAAIDALIQYGEDALVREAMLATIAKQTSPLVLVTLADALVQIRAKEGAHALQKVIDTNNVDKSIESKLKSTIQTLREI